MEAPQYQSDNNKPKILGVCLSPYTDNQPLIKEAIEIAERDQCVWYAISIDTHSDALDTINSQRLQRESEQVREAGGLYVRLPSCDVLQGVLTAAELHHITDLIIGKRHAFWWTKLLHNNLTNRLARVKAPFELHVVNLDNHSRLLESSSRTTFLGYAKAIGLILILTLVIEVIQESLPEYKFNASLYNVSMVYLLAISFSAIRFGVGAAIVAALISFSLYNYFFVVPFYEFALNQISDVLNFLLFIGAALLSLTTANIYKKRFSDLQTQEMTARNLYRLTKDIAGHSDKEEVIEILGEHLQEVLATDIALHIQNGSMVQTYPNEKIEGSIKAINTAYEKQTTQYEGEWAYYLLSTSQKRIGVLQVKYTDKNIYPVFIEALCYQAALSIERTLLIHEAEIARLESQKEALRSMLLSAVSHDLKTPLVSIIGSLSSIRHMDEKLSSSDRLELMATAIEEAERLNQSITNILDMTKIEAGELTPRFEWVNIESILADTVEKNARILSEHHINLELLNDFFELRIDPILFASLMQNLIENAVKYTPKGSEIVLSAELNEKHAIITLVDEGPGIPSHQRDKAFDKFTRLEQRDTRAAGTGLGLAICKAIAGVHNAAIHLTDNPKGTGLCVTLTFSEYQLLEDIASYE